MPHTLVGEWGTGHFCGSTTEKNPNSSTDICDNNAFYFQVKDIYLHPELFSVENGLLTPTFKTKRQEVQKYFAQQIDDMYRHLS